MIKHLNRKHKELEVKVRSLNKPLKGPSVTEDEANDNLVRIVIKDLRPLSLTEGRMKRMKKSRCAVQEKDLRLTPVTSDTSLRDVHGLQTVSCNFVWRQRPR